MKNAWFYEKLFFEVVIVMVNNKIQLKRYNDTMFPPPLPPRFLRTSHRSSRSQMFFKIGVLKNSTIVTGKHLC